MKLITNFKKEKEPIYVKAIERYGNGSLFIEHNAYWKNGQKDDSLYALWCCDTTTNLSEFFKYIHEESNDKKT